MSSTINCAVAAASTGSGILSGGCGGIFPNSVPISIWAVPNVGSNFVSWSCTNATTSAAIATSNANAITNITTPNGQNVNCEATFNLPPPPVSASVESDLALFLTFLGVIAITGFQRWRKRTES